MNHRAGDRDGDRGAGVVDAADNCPSAGNPSQDDGVDNDGDSAVDYPNDAGCRSAASTNERPACSDGVDGDGRTDGLLDVGCAGTSGLREDSLCADGVDNDGDERVDFDGGVWENSGYRSRRPTPSAPAYPRGRSGAAVSASSWPRS